MREPVSNFTDFLPLRASVRHADGRADGRISGQKDDNDKGKRLFS